MGRSQKRKRASSVLSPLARLPSAAATRVPLRWRLRNPPPLFLGRARERELLVDALARAPVALVCGPGGLGKTSLVLRVLAELDRGRAERVVCITVSPGDRSGEQAVGELLAALGEMLGGRALGGGLLPDKDALLATCIDLADALDAWIVVDDLHHAQGQLLEELLDSAVAYARRSRFVAASRVPPRTTALLAQTVALGPMQLDELTELAQRASSALTPADARAIAAEAGGSPFWLWQRLALGRAAVGAPSSGAAVGRALLSDLDPPTAAWVVALAHLEVPLPHGSVDALGVPAPPAAALARLEQRGLLERTPEGLRLHGVARAALAGDDPAPVARALSSADHPGLRVEAVRLLLAAGEVDTAVELLARTTDEALARGLGPRLWQVLARAPDPRLTATKLACAVDLGGGEAAAWALTLPAPADPRERLAWLTALAQAGHAEEVPPAAEALAAEVRRAEPALAAEALLAALRARVARGEAAAALQLAASLRATAPVERGDLAALADAWSARAHVFAGEHARALELVARLGARTSAWTPAVERELDDQRAVVLANLGRLRSSRAAFERAGASGIVSPEQLGARERLARGSLHALECGRLEDARALLDELAPVARRSPELFAFACMNELRYEAARGDLPAARRHLARLEQAVRASGSAYWAFWVASPRHYLGILQGAPFDPAEAAAGRDFPLTRALAAWHEVVATGTPERLAHEPAPDVYDAAIALQLAASAAALLAGDARRALREAQEATVRATSEGLVLWESDARLAAVEAAFVGGLDALGPALEDLEAVAVTLAPSRFEPEVRFFRAVAQGRDGALAALAVLAGSGPQATGAAARRSRALLGAASALDRVDGLVVARAGEVLGLQSLQRSVSAVRPGFGLDTRQGRVVLPGGKAVDLSGRPLLMRLLTALFEAGGEASKEALVQAVWGIADYHPLRDDKRLQVAVRRLRVLLEPGPEAPPILETTEQGYRLTTALPVYRTTGV